MGKITQDTKDLVEKAKHWMGKLLSFEAFAWVVEDTQHLFGHLKPISELGSIIKSRKTNEEWLRGDVAVAWKGKPVYLCLPEIPFTVGMEVVDGIYRNRDDYDPEYCKEKLTEYINISISQGERISRWDKIKTILYFIISFIGTSIVCMFAFGNPFGGG